MSSVRVDIEEAMAILKKIDATAQTYLEYQKAAQEIADELQQCWQGSSGQTAHEKAIVIKARQEKIANKILEASGQVQKQLQQLAQVDAELAAAIDHHSGGGRRG